MWCAWVCLADCPWSTIVCPYTTFGEGGSMHAHVWIVLYMKNSCQIHAVLNYWTDLASFNFSCITLLPKKSSIIYSKAASSSSVCFSFVYMFFCIRVALILWVLSKLFWYLEFFQSCFDILSSFKVLFFYLIPSVFEKLFSFVVLLFVMLLISFFNV